MPEGAVVVVSSHVARGSVGNRAMVFALERLGFEVWAVPTVTLTNHPGHGPAERIVPADAQFASLLSELVRDGRAAAVSGIVSGYLASPAQAAAVARLVAEAKAARPDCIYLCDPVIGDATAEGGARLYVDPALAEAVRDQLIPLADATTPNAFECAWLAGAPAEDADLVRLAHELGPPIVLVTSAPALMRGQIGNLLVLPRSTFSIEHPALATGVKGTGDLLAALLLARRLRGQSWQEAAKAALASVYEALAGTVRFGADELLLAKLQDALVRPHAWVQLRRRGAGG